MIPGIQGRSASAKLNYRFEALEGLHVVGTLEGGRFSHGLLTHSAAHLSDGFIFLLFHPAADIDQHGLNMVKTVLIER